MDGTADGTQLEVAATDDETMAYRFSLSAGLSSIARGLACELSLIMKDEAVRDVLSRPVDIKVLSWAGQTEYPTLLETSLGVFRRVRRLLGQIRRLYRNDRVEKPNLHARNKGWVNFPPLSDRKM
jgi:hypothetical protein